MTKIIKLDEAPTKSSRDMNGNMILLSKEIGTKGCNAVIIIKEPGVSDKPLLHYHHKREELFVVLEGRARGVVNGEEMILESGMAFPCRRQTLLSPASKASGQQGLQDDGGRISHR